MPNVIFYTTAGCSLCDQAKVLTDRLLPASAITFVDIVDDDELMKKYGERIPVLKCGDKEIGWPFSLLDIRELIRQ